MTLLLIKIHSETNIFLSSKVIWEREKRGLISYLLAWGNDQLLCLKILHSRKNEICLWKIGNERRDVLGDSRKRYHRPWTEIGKYWPRKEPIRLDLFYICIYDQRRYISTYTSLATIQFNSSFQGLSTSSKTCSIQMLWTCGRKKTFGLQGKHHSISFARLLLLLSSDKILYFAQLYRSKLEQR